jgi:hypothetical protein
MFLQKMRALGAGQNYAVRFRIVPDHQDILTWCGTWRSSPRCSNSFARVSAVLKLKVDDYYHNGARRRLRLHEKGGNEHEMPVHHLLEQILNEYIAAAGLQSGQPLFQSVNSLGTAVTGRALNR